MTDIRGASASVNAPAPNPPPLPPRPGGYQSSYSSPYNNFGSSYSGYGMGGGMFGNSMYGGFGNYGGGMYGGGYGGYNRFGQENFTTNTFARQAEESSRQAFQSVGSVVQAFGAIAMMLDSTFFAVQNSFRAVIGVADQMSRVKQHFAQILSAFAVLRTLRWLVRKILVFLRLRKDMGEDVWHEAAAEGMKALSVEQELTRGQKSNWPIMLFFAVVLGGPWLIWRLLSSMFHKGTVLSFRPWMFLIVFCVCCRGELVGKRRRRSYHGGW